MSAQTLDHLVPVLQHPPTTATAPPAAGRGAAGRGAGATSALPVTVRPARRADLAGLARLLVACSPSTRLGWCGRGGTVLPLAQQEAWLGCPGALVAEAAPGRLVAVAGLRAATCAGREDPIASTAELLVHDRWQRRGVATALLRHLAGVSLAAGRTELQAHPHGDAAAAASLLATLATHVGGRARAQQHPHGRCLRVHLPARSAARLGVSVDLPAGRRPDPAAGTGAVWAMAVPAGRAAAPR